MKRYILIMSIIGIGLLGLVVIGLYVYKYEAKKLPVKTVFIPKPAPYFPLSYVFAALMKE